MTTDLVLVYLLSVEERVRAVAQLNDLRARDALDIPHARALDCAEAHDIVAAGDRAFAVVLEI